MQCGKVDIEPLFEIDTAIDICAVIYFFTLFDSIAAKRLDKHIIKST